MLPTYSGSMARHQTGDAVRITTASRSAAEDIAARQKRYILAMGFRTVCFVAAIFVTITWAADPAGHRRFGAAVRRGSDGKCRGFEIRRIRPGQRAIRRQGAARAPLVPTRIPVRTTFDNWPKRARLAPEVPDSFPRGCPALPASTTEEARPRDRAARSAPRRGASSPPSGPWSGTTRSCTHPIAASPGSRARSTGSTCPTSWPRGDSCARWCRRPRRRPTRDPAA